MSTDPALCYDFSTFFGSDELSDLTLVLTAGPEEQQPPPAKKARGKKKATAAPVPANECQQQLPGHAMVLAGCSPVFKAQLMRWKQEPAGERSSQPIITLRVDSPDQLEAARALVQYMYQRRLPADASQQLLVTMLQLSDMFDVQMCAAACGKALSTQELEWDTVMQVLALPASFGTLQQFSSVFSKAGDQLQQRLGDLEVAWASDELRGRFLALPFKGVELLIADKRTRVANENTVLVAVGVWITEHSDSVTEEEMTQLAELIRLPYLTAYAGFTLAMSMPWLNNALTPSLLAAAMGTAATIGRDGQSAQHVLSYTKLNAWPACWGLDKRPASHQRRVCMEWRMPLQQLKRTFSTGEQQQSPAFRFGGLEWHILLYRQSAGHLSMAVVHRVDARLQTGMRAAGTERPPVSIDSGSITAIKPAHSDRPQAASHAQHKFSLRPPSAVGVGVDDLWKTGTMPEWDPQRFKQWVGADGLLTVLAKVSAFH